MADLYMDAVDGHPLDLSRVPSNVITMMLQSMSLSDRFTCALVCKAWADEAIAATRSIILRDRVQDFSCLQRWLDQHGGQVEVLQLHGCADSAVLTALPCLQLQDLLLGSISLDSRVWSDLAAATKLTAVTLKFVRTASQQADVVSALTALPDLEQLTWSGVQCGPQQRSLSDSKLLRKLTKLTALALFHVDTAAALEHLGSLTRLQDLSLAADDWAAAGCPGLQELKALTRLELLHRVSCDIPLNISQLTSLQQLDVSDATPTGLNQLSALTGLTRLRVMYLVHLSPGSPPLQLRGLRHFELFHGLYATMPMSYLGSCTQLQVLMLSHLDFSGPGSLVASSMLQRLELDHCRISAADGDAGPVSWQQVFPGPGRLPHLTSRRLIHIHINPDLQHADIECVVACCSSLQLLEIEDLPDSITSELAHLSGLTSLILSRVSDQQCNLLAQLTGLRELRVDYAREVFAAGLQQLAALEQLTSLCLNYLGWSSDVLSEHMSDRTPGRPTYDYHRAIINQVCVCGGGRAVLPYNHRHQIAVVWAVRLNSQSHLHHNTQACISTEHEQQ